MTFDLRRKKVMVISGQHSIGRAIAEAVAREGADVVIWLRKYDDELNGARVLSITTPPPRQCNGATPISLWRQAIARKSYW